MFLQNTLHFWLINKYYWLTLDDKNAVDCDWMSLVMRDIDSVPSLPLRCPLIIRCWFSSTLVENLFANFNAFGDRRKRNDLDNVGGLGSMIGWIRTSGDILWMTRTPSRTIDRRVKRSSVLSAVNWKVCNNANMKQYRSARWRHKTIRKFSQTLPKWTRTS